jgi:glyoxylase-like metal-dependent hydrolase (beta-lactamase superfamily II)
LFIGGCGRVDLPGSDPAQMYDSLVNKLRALPDHTVLYPGHDYADRPSSTIGDEKRRNPYLRFTRLEDFLGMMGS